jgi:Flp pilus assembly protein TadD
MGYQRTGAKLIAVAISSLMWTALAGAQLRITVPKRSKATPVQQLNIDGVKAVRKHDYEKAKKLFYKAYLIDPNDPFTLNNLGYISELEGRVDRAERFYALAAEQNSDAAVDRANMPEVEGKPVSQVAGNANDRAMQVNRFNVQAIGLLQKDRAPEADLVLQRALAIDPANPFTLNNMGFTKEKEGELESALSFYTKAAQAHSQEPVVVTMNSDWRGKAISEIADRNAKQLRKQMQKEESIPVRVTRLNLRGVSAINRNDRDAARQDFQQAYKLDPNNAFTLNNLGYMAEVDGDRETADFYYAKAQESKLAEQKVSVATRREAEGRKLGVVAESSDQQVLQRMEAALMEKRREGGPVRLMRRDNTPVIEPEKPPTPAPQPEKNTHPSGGLLMPLPENKQPPNAGGPTTTPGNSQPTNPQPAGTPASTQPAATQPNGGLLMPLPDNQQPPNADRGAPAAPANPQPPANSQPKAQPQSQPNSQQPNGGVLEPLPDNQQPPNAGPVPQNQPQ